MKIVKKRVEVPVIVPSFEMATRKAESFEGNTDDRKEQRAR